ncbi:MAG: apolipoprotein N-acyltransferase [Halanaerobium sp.]
MIKDTVMALFLTILSAALATAANYNGDLYFLTWTALLPFLYYLFIYKNQELTYKSIFLKGWNLGFWILVFTANFLYNSIKLYTEAPFLIIILILFLLFLLLSLIYGLFFVLYLFLQKKLFAQNGFRALLFAAVWTLMELSRYYLLSFFPIANPAYTQANFFSFIQLVEFGGIWILTFILILVNGLLFQLIFEKKYKNIFILSIIFFMIFGTGFFLQEREFKAGREEAKALEIGIITTQIEQEKKWKAEQLSENIELTLNAASKLNQTQLIIAPETNITFDFYNNHNYKDQFLEKVESDFEAPIQIGALASKNPDRGRYNSVFLLSDTGEIISRYDKNLLLYFGETYPFLELLNEYTEYSFSSLNPGKELTVFKFGELRWRTVICSEILYPSYVKKAARDVDFIVNQTNEAWFKNNKLLKNIMWQAAVLRAVENRVPIIKTGNQAHSGIIYPGGSFKKVDPEKNYHILNLK